MINYFEILNVSENADLEVIRASYKALAKKYHPDNNDFSKEEAEEKMALLNEAYDVLSNEESRKRHLEKLHAERLKKQEESTNFNKKEFESEKEIKHKKKKPFYKRIWFWIVVLWIGWTFLFNPSADESIKENESVKSEISDEDKIAEENIEVDKNTEVKDIAVDYGFLYGGIMDSVISEVSEKGGNTEYLMCVLYDMNKDGYKEFIIENGTCAADVAYEVYTTDGETTIYLGEILSGYCSFYKEENGNGIYTDYCNGGYECINYVYIDNGNLISETVLEHQTDNYGYYEGKAIEELIYPLEMVYLHSIDFNAYNEEQMTMEKVEQEEFIDSNEYADYEAHESEMVESNDYSVYSLEYVAEYIENHKIDIPKERYKNKINKALTDDSEMIAVEASGSEKIRYSATTYDDEFYYVGDMKDNVPNGWGKIIRIVKVSEMEYYGCPLISIGSIAWGWSNEDELVPILVYVGEFEDGYYSGYGWKYADHFETKEIYEREISFEYVESSVDLAENILMNCNPVEYMGEFKKGLYDGDGILISYGAREIPFEMTDEEQIALTGVVVDKEIEFYIGEFKKGELRGTAKHYLLGNLLYEGDYFDWCYDGEGTLYYMGTTQKKYDGEWKNGEYHGKGTLYNEDGSVQYKGKWIMGDYAN